MFGENGSSRKTWEKIKKKKKDKLFMLLGFIYFYSTCMGVLPACLGRVPGARGGQKRARDSSGSAFIHIVSHHVGAGNPFLGLLEEQQML